MRRLSGAGVAAGVLLAPVLPGITDSAESIEAVMAAAAEHGAVAFGSAPLRLAPGVREHYLGFVRATHPALLPRYERAYAGTYAPPEYVARLTDRIDRLRERYGFLDDPMRQRRLVPRQRPLDAPLGRTAGPQLALPLG